MKFLNMKTEFSNAKALKGKLSQKYLRMIGIGILGKGKVFSGWHTIA